MPVNYLKGRHHQRRGQTSRISMKKSILRFLHFQPLSILDFPFLELFRWNKHQNILSFIFLFIRLVSGQYVPGFPKILCRCQCASNLLLTFSSKTQMAPCTHYKDITCIWRVEGEQSFLWVQKSLVDWVLLPSFQGILYVIDRFSQKGLTRQRKLALHWRSLPSKVPL